MGKEWDGIINLWKCLWQSPEFVSTAASLLTYCRVDSTTDEASIVPANASTPEPPSKTPDNAPCAQINSLFSDVLKNASVRLIAVTKHDLLASLNGSSPSLTKMLAASLNGVSENASFVLPILLPKAESSNTVVRNVTRLLKAKECQERQTTFTKTETARIKEVIVEMAGGTFASKSTPEINGLVDFVESTATGEKYNATILRPTLTAELTKNLTLLLFASLVTRRWNEILQDLIKTFFTLIFREVYRTLKPGGYVLAFAGTRTYQYLASAIEDAGFEIRDQIQWIYGSGFPKSRDIGKDIEKLKVGGIKNLKQIGSRKGLNNEGGTQGFSYQKEYVPGVSIGGKQVNGQIPVYEITNDWQGFGTALKPAHEPICLARKPLEKGLTVAQNVLKWGTGALNIDKCRVETDGEIITTTGMPKQSFGGQNHRPWHDNPPAAITNPRTGRFPANVILSWPEDEYQMRGDIPADVKKELFNWLNENA